MTQENDKVTVNLNQLMLTASSVNEIYDRFVENAGICMPPREDTGMKLMNAYIEKKVKYVLIGEGIPLKMRKVTGMKIETITKFLTMQGYADYVPPKNILYRLNRDWLIVLCKKLCKDNFEKWVADLEANSTAGMDQAANTITGDAHILNSMLTSKKICKNKRGRGIHGMKTNKKKKLTKKQKAHEDFVENLKISNGVLEINA